MYRALDELKLSVSDRLELPFKLSKDVEQTSGLLLRSGQGRRGVF